MVGVDQRVIGDAEPGTGGRHALDHEATAVGVEQEVAVGAGQVGAEHDLEGLVGGRPQQCITDDRGPGDADGAVDAGEVVDTDADAVLVHADLAEAAGGGEHECCGPVVGADA